MSDIWELCTPDSDQLSLIENLEVGTKFSNIIWESVSTSNDSPNLSYPKEEGVDDLQSVLDSAESSCSKFISELVSTLSILDDVANAYSDVTGRTNNLMINCENLLEQQVSLIYLNIIIISYFFKPFLF